MKGSDLILDNSYTPPVFLLEKSVQQSGFPGAQEASDDLQMTEESRRLLKTDSVDYTLARRTSSMALTVTGILSSTSVPSTSMTSCGTEDASTAVFCLRLQPWLFLLRTDLRIIWPHLASGTHLHSLACPGRELYREGCASLQSDACASIIARSNRKVLLHCTSADACIDEMHISLPSFLIQQQ